MLVVQAFHPGDADQALRFAKWAEELGGAKGHELLLIPDTTCTPAAVEEIRQTFARSFDSVEVLPFVDHFRTWPSAPNAIFGMAARHIMSTRPQPWLFCEPDCVPMASGWLDALWAEYQAAGKPFLGDFVSVHTPEFDVPDHMSGNAIYPADMFVHAGTALIAGDTAWDVVSAEQVLPQMQTSALISHAWKHPTFANMEQVQREIYAIKPQCVLFHASKDGSLIQILRQERSKTYGNTNDESERETIRAIPENPAQPSEREQKAFGVKATHEKVVAHQARTETSSESSRRSGSEIGQDNQADNLQPLPKADREQAPSRPSRELREADGSDVALSKLPQQFARDLVLAEPSKTGEKYRERIREARESTNVKVPGPIGPDSSRGGQFISGPADEPNAATDHGSGAGNSFTCDILIKSYPPDYELLSYCLRSIEKFATGFRRTILIIPRGTYAQLSEALSGIEFLDFVNPVEVEETGEGYLFQQAVKINAHEYTDADYILHIDSDTMLTKPVTPETFFRDGKPLWLKTPYAVFEKELHDNPNLLLGVMAWKPITEKFVGEPVEYEFMRRPPMLIPRSLHVSADVFCRVRHKMSLAQYILSQPHRAFSEFNALGALAYSRARDEFSWLDTTKEELPELVAIQRWSHQPLTDAIRGEMEQILSGGVGAPCNETEEAKQGIDEPRPTGVTRSTSVSPAGSMAQSAQAIRQTAAGHWIINGDTHISAWVEEKGQLQHDFQTLPLILAEINAGDVVVDVGANIGDTASPFLEKVGPNGMVFTFEPNHLAFECLKKNLASYPNARFYGFALSDVTENLSMEVSDNVGAGHITPPILENDKVQSVTLDSICLAKCDFIKIDVEGYELNVLRGAEQTISKFRPKMAIEINEGALRRQGTTSLEVFNWLDNHGYQVWPLVPPDRNQELPQYDILCRPMEIYDTPVGKKVRYKNEPRAHSENLERKAAVGFDPAHGKDETVRYEIKDGQFTPLNPSWHPQVPWENKDESIEEIRRLIARLKEFCSCPAYTNKVRAELKARKVIR